MEEDMNPSIREFYRDRHILVTGGTGFMGKVLIEKLVRSCSCIGKIYVLIRPKKDKYPADRIRELTEQKFFDTVKKEQPGALERILVPVYGDVAEKNLGLSAEDEDVLVQNVSVIFHSAATIRFDEPVQAAILLNTRGTSEVVNLAKKMPNIKALLHVSTAYCNCMRMQIEEKLYPMEVGWKEAIDVAEKVDPASLNILSMKYLGTFPNTYTFTKNLAEHAVSDNINEVPSVIFRPVIVISTLKDPMPGWIDNYNGPIGLFVGAGRGVLRTAMANDDAVPSYMPVDVAIKGMIVAAWLKGIEKEEVKRTLPVYNCASRETSLRTGEVSNLGFRMLLRYPYARRVIWYPGIWMTMSVSVFYWQSVFLHLIPGFIADTYLKLKRKKPVLVDLYRRYYLLTLQLYYFTAKEWTFYNDKFLGLVKKIHSVDRDDFDFSFENVSAVSYFEDSLRGGYLYLIKHDISTLPAARIYMRKMYWLKEAVKGIFGIITGVTVWFVLISYIPDHSTYDRYMEKLNTTADFWINSTRSYVNSLGGDGFPLFSLKSET